MTKTYVQLMKQIDVLSKEAERLRRKEVDGVIARIRQAIDAYGLTAEDLGLEATRGPKKEGIKKAAKSATAKRAKPVRFPDDAGNTWIGRGPRPAWITEALKAGRKLADFAV